MALFRSLLKDWSGKTTKRARKGSGSIVVIGFAVVALILLLVQYLTPPEVILQVGVSDDFTDTVSYIDSSTHITSTLVLDPEERCVHAEEAVNSIQEDLAERGTGLGCLATLLDVEGDNPRLTVFYTLEKGESYLSGFAGSDILANLPAGSDPWGEGQGGGGGGTCTGCDPEADLGDCLVWFPSAVDRLETHTGMYHVAALLINTCSKPIDVTLYYEGDDPMLRWLVVPFYCQEVVHGDQKYINFRISGRSRYSPPVQGIAIVHIWLTRHSGASDTVHAYPYSLPSFSSDSSSDLMITWSSDIQTHLSRIRTAFAIGTQQTKDWPFDGPSPEW